MNLCDSNCNQCPIVLHPNSRMVTKILNELLAKHGGGVGDCVYKIVQNNCPNLTVCYDCRIDDFCHMEGCELIQKEKTELVNKGELTTIKGDELLGYLKYGYNFHKQKTMKDKVANPSECCGFESKPERQWRDNLNKSILIWKCSKCGKQCKVHTGSNCQNCEGSNEKATNSSS